MRKTDKPFAATLDGRTVMVHPSTYREVFLRGTPILDFVTVAYADNTMDEVCPSWLKPVKRRKVRRR
jgi:hypothetical protein